MLLPTAGPPARAEPPLQSAAAVPQSLTPLQAQQAISVLEDPQKRSELLQTLHAIAQAAPMRKSATQQPAPPQKPDETAAAPAPAEPAAPDTEAAPAPAAQPAQQAAHSESPIPLTSGGLIAQLLASGSQWFSTLSGELWQTARSATRIDVFMRWITRVGENAHDRAEVVSGAWRFIVVFLIGLAAEFIARRALRSPFSGRHRRALPEAAQTKAPANLLHRLPLALARLLLDLLPIGAFAALGNFLIAALGSDETTAAVLATAVNAYAIWRACTVLTHSLVSPGNPQLRLFAIGDDVAHYIERWVARLAGVAVFGIALVSIAGLVGLYPAAYRTLNNLVLLIVHALLIVMVVQSRRRVAGWIHAPEGASGAFALLRNRIAPMWHVIAILLIVASWMVDAVEIQNGYTRLMRFVFLSALVLICARLLSILVLGVIDRTMGPAPAAALPHGTKPPTRLSEVLHRSARAAIGGITIFALLEVWGVDAVTWFESGAIGRRLLSAALTIGFAALAGMALWEWANAALERYLERLTHAGDHARLARMRTLLPMMRTTLFIVLLLVIGLTGLSEIGVNIAPLLAGAGIVGIAVGFGSQKLVQDLITGIFLLVENAFQVGDWVTVAGLSGSVEHLTIRSVRLRSVDGAVHIVPFSAVSTVSNASRDVGMVLVSVTVALEEDIDHIGEVLKQIAAEMRREPHYQKAISSDLDVWGVDKLEANGATLTAQIRCTVEGRGRVQREFTHRLKRKFQELGIKLVAAAPAASPALPA